MAPEELRYRPVAAVDGPVLFRLFRQVHADEIATLSADAGTRDALASMQYVENAVRLRTEFPDAVDLALEHAGEVCGRMLSVMRGGGIQLVELDVLNEHRGQGIATLAMQHLAHVAADHGCPIWMRADAASADCRGFLERIGFAVTGRGGRLVVEQHAAVAA